MCNPAKHATGLGFFLRKKAGSNYFILGNKGGDDLDLIGDVFYFFCHQNRRFFCGDGGSRLGPDLLWRAWPEKVLMIKKK